MAEVGDVMPMVDCAVVGQCTGGGEEEQGYGENFHESETEWLAGGSGGGEREARELDADVVVASGGDGEIEQCLGGGFRGEIGVARDGLKRFLVDVSPETVGTEHQAVAREEHDFVDIDFDLGAVAEAAGEN